MEIRSTYIIPTCTDIDDPEIDDYLLTVVGIIPTPEVRAAFLADRTFGEWKQKKESDG